MLTLETAGALVSGGPTRAAIEQEKRMLQPQAAQQSPTQKVRVLRAFYYQGKPVEKDSTVVLPRVFALEMQAAKKAEFVVEAEQPVVPQAPVQPAKADDASKKEKSNAR